MDAKELSIAIKAKLVELASNDQLPMDMNQLDASVIENIINEFIPETGENWKPDSNDTFKKLFDRAGRYLCDNDECSIAEQITLIRAHENQKDLIDNIEGVLVWSPLSFSLSCDEFFSLIED